MLVVTTNIAPCPWVCRVAVGGRSSSRKIPRAGRNHLRKMKGPMEKYGREMLLHVGPEKLKQLIELLEPVRSRRAFRRRARGVRPLLALKDKAGSPFELIKKAPAAISFALQLSSLATEHLS